MEGLELICFQIISAVGTARSSYIEAVKIARNGDIPGAKAAIEKGEEEFLKGHSAHAELITQEASGKKVIPSLLLLHAEDQLMAAETYKQVAIDLIEMQTEIEGLKRSVAGR